MIRARGVPELVWLLELGREGDAWEVASALGRLAENCLAGQRAVVDEGGVPGLVRMMASNRMGLATSAIVALDNVALKYRAGQ